MKKLALLLLMPATLSVGYAQNADSTEKLLKDFENARKNLQTSLDAVDKAHREGVFNFKQLAIHEDFASADVVTQALKETGTAFRAPSGNMYHLKYDNVLYSPYHKMLSSENPYGVFKKESIGFGFASDKEKELYKNSKSREVSVEISRSKVLMKGQKARSYYGISLTAAKGNDIKHNYEKEEICYALLVNNSSYKIVKYVHDGVYWDKESETLVKPENLPQEKEIHTLAIKKLDNTWTFYVDGTEVHNLVDNEYLHVNTNMGDVIQPDKSTVLIYKYDFRLL